MIKRGSNGFLASGRNRTIKFNPGSKSGGIDVNGKTKRPAFVGLGHELAHAFDALDNQIAPDAASLRSR